MLILKCDQIGSSKHEHTSDINWLDGCPDWDFSSYTYSHSSAHIYWTSAWLNRWAFRYALKTGSLHLYWAKHWVQVSYIVLLCFWAWSFEWKATIHYCYSLLLEIPFFFVNENVKLGGWQKEFQGSGKRIDREAVLSQI